METHPQENLEDMTNKIINLLNPKLFELYDLANHTQVILLKELRAKYGKELKSGHKPSKFDIHKNEHMLKVGLARELEEACKIPITNLTQLNNFITHYHNAVETNLSLLKGKGGRLGDILKTCEPMFIKLKDHLDDYNKKINDLSDYMIKLLSHYKAIEQERLLDVKDNLSYDKASSFLPRLHQLEIMKYKDQIIGLIKSDYKKDEIQITLNLDKLNELSSSSSDSKTVHNNIQILNTLTLPCWNIQLSSDLTSKELQNLTEDEKFKIAFMRTIVHDFENSLKLEEKMALWKAHYDETINPDSSLQPTRRKERLDWYVACGTEEDYLDTFKTGALIKNLNALVGGKEVDINDIKNEINEHIQRLTKTYQSLSQYDSYKGLFISRWIEKLTTIFDNFLVNMKNAENIIQHKEPVLSNPEQKAMYDFAKAMYDFTHPTILPIPASVQ